MRILDCLEFQPKDDIKPIGSVIWLHGLGADATDFSPLVPHMQLPDVRFVFPNAPLRPVTIHGGMSTRSWYDIRTLEASSERESWSDALISAQAIEEVIHQEMQRGIPSENIVLMGFSQGAAMALHVGHRFEHRLRGVMVLSGYMLKPAIFKEEMHPSNRYTPFHFYHGTRDLVVNKKRGDEACDITVESHRFTYWKEYPMGHEVCLEELRHIRVQLHEWFMDIRRQNRAAESQK